MLDNIHVIEPWPEVVYTQIKSVLTNILQSSYANIRKCLKDVTSINTSKLKASSWARYYIPCSTPWGLVLVGVNLKLKEGLCIGATWPEKAAFPQPTTTPEGLYWTIDEEWHKAYKAKGGAPNTAGWGPIFLCRPYQTHLIDSYWFAGPNKLAWNWATRLKYDDSSQELQDDSLHQSCEQSALLSPFVVAALTGSPDR